MKSVVVSVASVVSVSALASAPPGQPAPGFILVDIFGHAANLEDYKGRIVVLEWNNFGCPFVQKHYRTGNMQALQKKYGDRVVWLTLNSTSKSSPEYRPPLTLEATLAVFGAQPSRYLMDDPGLVGMAYGAKTTPHMFVIDATGKVVYNGAIDDKRSVELSDVRTARNYVAAALDEVIAGKPVSTPSTTPYGCSIKY